MTINRDNRDALSRVLEKAHGKGNVSSQTCPNIGKARARFAFLTIEKGLAPSIAARICKREFKILPKGWE
jgi:hypothetical protein